MVLSNERFFKVSAYEVVDDRIHLELAEGGRVTLPMRLVERIVDDEIVEVEEPPPEEARELDLGFDENSPKPETPYGELIWELSRQRDLSPALVAAMIRHESSFRPRVVSVKGARGLMQLMPATAHRFGVAEHELFDPRRNLEAGTAYLRFLIDRFDGRLLHVLAAYNAGEGAVDRYSGVPPYRETRTYIQRILSTLGLGEDGKPVPPAEGQRGD
ncbi:MAG: lytic transglycosylase domain-containing protein [Acidobacteriota bacterium]